MEQRYLIPNMMCKHCAKTITNSLMELPEVVKVEIDLATKVVTINLKDELDDHQTLISQLAKSGFNATKI